MNNKVVKISFNVWANSEEEGVELQQAICSFIDKQGQEGRKVSASKLTEALNKWANNPFIKQTINNHFK